MNLDTYLAKSGTSAALAAKIGVTPGFVSQWRSGHRPIPIERCVEIEAATDGLVTRQELRPDDWQKIWPELIETHSIAA